MKLHSIRVEDIEPGHRARKKYGNIEELSASVKEMGVIVPIAVMLYKGNEDKIEWKTDCKYLLLHGGRRLKAAIIANLAEVPALIFDREVGDMEAWNIELVENLHREDLAWPEEIDLKRRIHAAYIEKYGEKRSTAKEAKGWSQTDTAKVLSISPQQLGSDLTLAEALQRAPDLSTIRTKADALKVLSASVEVVERRQVVEEIERKAASTPMEKYKKGIVSRFMVGRIKEEDDLLKKGFFEGVIDIPGNSVDFVEVDPPYGIDLDKQKKDMSGTASIMSGYNEIDRDIYFTFLDKVMKESYRILREGGHAILWFGPEPWFDTALRAMKKAGFRVRGIPGMWCKGSGQTMAPNIYLANSYEMFFYGMKGNGEIVKKGRSNIFHFSPVTPTKKIHQTERPIEMMEEILMTFVEPGSKVCVPFLGSGNTILAADNVKMTAFGWELTKEYKDGFTLRVSEKTFSEYKFHSY